ncbi:MAG: SsrA-binding protein SmpB [Spirochaetes bacterium]|nr:SsrA-binding protein SmpB [Spirochaetota bacterium]
MPDNFKDIANNKKARFEYEILETFEAGIVLKGTEVKSLREGKTNISDAYAKIRNGEIFIHQMNISVYKFGNIHNHDPQAVRKLLMHKKEIKKLTGKINEKGYTVIPLKIYFKNGLVKLLIGLGRGKALYDKRQDLKKKDATRDLQRIMKNVNK